MPQQNDVVARYNQKKKKMKKRKKIAFYTVLVTFFVVVVTVLSLTVFFNISSIEIKGNSFYTDAQILKVSGLKKGQNLFRLNKFEIIDKLELELPYLGEVSIKRKLPVGIEITVKETEPFMCIASGKDTLLLDTSLKILAKTDVEPVGLATVMGIRPKNTKVGTTFTDKDGLCKHLKQLSEVLRENLGAGKVSEINITEVYEISIVYEERVTVKFGTLENIVEKVRLVAHTLETNSPSERAEIEFSLDNRLHYRALD